jgi:UPF0755 protein
MTEVSLSDVVPGPPQGSRRRSQRAAEKRRKRRRRRTWVTVLITVVALGAAGAGAWLGLRPIIASFNTPDDYTGSGTEAVAVRIPPGASGSKIATILVDAGVVKTANAYLDAAADTPGSQGIQPGTYAMKKQMPAQAALQALLDPASRQLKRVTLPEGSRLANILARIAKDTGIPKADLDAAAKNTAALGLPEGEKSVEGYLFPATYDVEPQTTAEELLREMVAKTQDTLAELGVPEKDHHRVLTVASLVQAEGRGPDDMGKISRVIATRLSKGIKLQFDSTVHYALGRFSRVRTTNADLAVESRYNTYKYKGLPPGPIGSPGLDALKATLNPTPGPWIYFVATDPSKGVTKFAETEEQFAVLKAEYEKWQKAHPGQ